MSNPQWSSQNRTVWLCSLKTLHHRPCHLVIQTKTYRYWKLPTEFDDPIWNAGFSIIVTLYQIVPKRLEKEKLEKNGFQELYHLYKKCVKTTKRRETSWTPQTRQRPKKLRGLWAPLRHHSPTNPWPSRDLGCCGRTSTSVEFESAM